MTHPCDGHMAQWLLMPLACGAMLWAGLRPAGGAGIQPIAYRVPAKAPDVLQQLSPGDMQLYGWLGERVAVNEKNRLLKVDLEPLLAGFRHKPGTHPWIGEHIGKWMHASVLAWAYTGDEALRRKLDYAAAALIKAQESDGYLGTYLPDKRFGLYRGADWDVWSHKYCLIGLLTYYRFTGNAAALEACRKAGDLLVKTFGPGKKDILDAGTHVGMAATSVMEPMVLLYRHTGDPRYLEFARYLTRAWDEPNGPKIITTLLKKGHVNETANGKAYEMLSNLVGLCELTRATGDRELLKPVLIAWRDIVDKRLYLTGSASQGEHFHDDFYLPNQYSAHPMETCVTVTWVQLNMQLLRLTGKSCFGDQLERTFYNQLTAAQRPDGAEWCYFTPLEGTKHYGPGISCCVSSGPRGVALIPQQTYLKKPARGTVPDFLAINLFEPSRVVVTLGGQAITVRQETDFPRSGKITLQLQMDRPARFGLQLRATPWGGRPKLTGPVARDSRIEDGWLRIPARQWKNGDRIEFELRLVARLVHGAHGNAGHAAMMWGPIVLAYDQQQNPSGENPRTLGLVQEDGRPPFTLNKGDGTHLIFAGKVRSPRNRQPHAATFVPFADAGATGSQFQVWLVAPGADLPAHDEPTAFMPESRSRQGNQHGSITDGDPTSIVVTFDGTRRKEDWYAVTLNQPATVRHVVFVHGRKFHDGGWFDTSKGKPRIEVQHDKNGPWETVATLTAYPTTTATEAVGLRDGQVFKQEFSAPVKAVAIRVIGTPACGDNPAQAFSSCAELQARE